jgi:voltage-gated potassium channel
VHGEDSGMEGQAPTGPPSHGRAARWVERRIERKGLRPRLAALVIISFWSVAVIVFGIVERLIDPDTFDTVWLGMWWAIQTVTTVGYGDVVPETTAGKVIASFLMLGGLSLLAVVTGAVTSAFVTRAQLDRQRAGDDPISQRLAEISAQLAALQEEVARRDPSG